MKTVFFIIGLVIGLCAGCGKKTVKPPPWNWPAPIEEDETKRADGIMVIPDPEALPPITPTFWIVNFEFDSADLSAEARYLLYKNWETISTMKTNPMVTIEGHCDPAGTVGYNLALGQKRAESVRSYYISLGFPEKSIFAVSYGEEVPMCGEETDACNARNRRAVTVIEK